MIQNQTENIRKITVKLKRQGIERQEEIAIDGNGDIPVLYVGTGSIDAQFIPDKLKHGKNGMTLYCVDFDFMANPTKVINKDRIQKKTADDLIEEIEESRKALGLDKVALLTHSSYFGIGLLYAIKYPERVLWMKSDGAPLSALNFTSEGSANRFFEETATDEQKKLARYRWVQYLKYLDTKQAVGIPDSESVFEWTLAGMGKGAYDKEKGVEISKIWKKGISGKIPNEVMREHYFWNIFNKEIAPNIEKWLQEVKVPIHFVYGKRDNFLNMPLIYECAKIYLKHSFDFLPHSKHYPMYEEPKAYVKCTKDFLTNLKKLEVLKSKKLEERRRKFDGHENFFSCSDSWETTSSEYGKQNNKKI